MGFTLVELLVVIGIIGVLIALLMPALVRAREQAKFLTCSSQVRQLTMAWMNYAVDNKGLLPGGGTVAFPDWVCSSAGTDEAGIKAGSLWKYLRTTAIYRCPAEPREEYAWSYSLVDPASGLNVATGEWRKISQIRPAERQALILEDNDNRGSVQGSWIMNPGAPAFVDMLAPWHRVGRMGGTPIGYADGHVEGHYWTDRRTTAFAFGDPDGHQPDNRDLLFLVSVYVPPR